MGKRPITSPRTAVGLLATILVALAGCGDDTRATVANDPDTPDLSFPDLGTATDVDAGDDEPDSEPDIEPDSEPDESAYFVAGDPIDGSVSVKVELENGRSVSGAAVAVLVESGDDRFATTGDNGRVTVEIERGASIVTVAAGGEGLTTELISGVDRDAVTVPLRCIDQGTCRSSRDCDEGFLCTCGPPARELGSCRRAGACGTEAQDPDSLAEYCNIRQFGTATEGDTEVIVRAGGAIEVGPGEAEAAFLTRPLFAPLRGGNLEGSERLPFGTPFTVTNRGYMAGVLACGSLAAGAPATSLDIQYLGFVAIDLADPEVQALDRVEVACDVPTDSRLSIDTGGAIFDENPGLEVEYTAAIRTPMGYFIDLPTTVQSHGSSSARGYPRPVGSLSDASYVLIGRSWTDSFRTESITRAEADGLSFEVELLEPPTFDQVDVVDGLLLDLSWTVPDAHEYDFFELSVAGEGLLFPVLSARMLGDERSVRLPLWPEGVGIDNLQVEERRLELTGASLEPIIAGPFTFDSLDVLTWRTRTTSFLYLR